MCIFDVVAPPAIIERSDAGRAPPRKLSVQTGRAVGQKTVHEQLDVTRRKCGPAAATAVLFLSVEYYAASTSDSSESPDGDFRS